MFVISFSTFYAPILVSNRPNARSTFSTSRPEVVKITQNYTQRYYILGYNLAFFIIFAS